MTKRDYYFVHFRNFVPKRRPVCGRKNVQRSGHISCNRQRERWLGLIHRHWKKDETPVLQKFDDFWATSTLEAWIKRKLWKNGYIYFTRKWKSLCKVVVFLRNATCHPHLSISHVKLTWFPANTTSIIEPMDQGVIHYSKEHYRP